MRRMVTAMPMGRAACVPCFFFSSGFFKFTSRRPRGDLATREKTPTATSILRSHVSSSRSCRVHGLSWLRPRVSGSTPEYYRVLEYGKDPPRQSGHAPSAPRDTGMADDHSERKPSEDTTPSTASARLGELQDTSTNHATGPHVMDSVRAHTRGPRERSTSCVVHPPSTPASFRSSTVGGNARTNARARRTHVRGKLERRRVNSSSMFTLFTEVDGRDLRWRSHAIQ